MPTVIGSKSTVIESESKLTARYQTTVPAEVRKALGLGKRDKIRYSVQPDGQVVMRRAVPERRDPVLGRFLRFLAEDMKTHPERLHAVDAGLVDRARSLVGDVEVDLNAPLSPDDE